MTEATVGCGLSTRILDVNTGGRRARAEPELPELLPTYDTVMRRKALMGLAFAVLAVGAVIALLLPARWTCPPMGYCPVAPRDLNAPIRVLALVVGLIGPGVVMVTATR